MIRAMLSAALLSSLFVFGGYGEAQDTPSGVNTTQVREDLKLVLGEYAEAHADYIRALGEARSKQDRDKAEQMRPKPIRGAARYLEWAENNPKDPLAVDALVAIVKHGRFTSEAQRAAKMLASQHLNMASDKFNEAAFYVILWPMPVVDR